MPVPDGLEVFLVPALVLLIILYHVGRILYREMKAGYEGEMSEEVEAEQYSDSSLPQPLSSYHALSKTVESGTSIID